MAHTVTLVYGGSSLALATTTASPTSAGIVLIDFVPPDTGATTMDLTIRIYDTSADLVDAKLNTLAGILELARLWADQPHLTPVFLQWQRQGETNSAYRQVVGWEGMPVPVGGGRWIDVETGGKFLTVRFPLLLSPQFHSVSQTTALNASSKTNTPALNTAAITTASTLPAPVFYQLTSSTASSAWTTVMLARTPEVAVIDYSGTGGISNAYNSAIQSLSVTGTESSTVIDTTIQIVYGLPLRVLARGRVTSGTPGKLLLRAQMDTGQGTTYTEWQTFAGTTNNMLVTDLGAFPPARSMLNYSVNAPMLYTLSLRAKTSDSSSVTYQLDYVEYFYYWGFVTLTIASSVDQNGYAVYETMGLQSGGSSYFPMSSPRVYGRNAGASSIIGATRSGSLPPETQATTGGYVWASVQTASLHTIANTFTITHKYLKSYHLLRGSA